MSEYYLWIKAFHMIFVISWMVGLLYLPRLYVYHCDAPFESETDKLFKTMEKRLLKIIMNPAMILTLISGFMLVHIIGFKNLGTWFHIKLSLVLMLIYFHHFLAKIRKVFELGKNTKDARFYRLINEIPTILMISIVILVIVKPFVL